MYGPSYDGESLWRFLLLWTRRSTRSPTLKARPPHSTVVVPTQYLLILGRAKEGDITCFILLVHGIFEGCLSSLFVIRPDPWCSIVEVSREDSFRAIDHEERCVAGGPAGVVLGLQSTTGSSATYRASNLFNWLKILGLRPCRTRPFVRSTYPFMRGCATVVQSAWMWYSS